MRSSNSSPRGFSAFSGWGFLFLVMRIASVPHTYRRGQGRITAQTATAAGVPGITMFSQGARQPASSLALSLLQEASCRQETGIIRICCTARNRLASFARPLAFSGGQKEFCSKRCADGYVKESQQQEKLNSFFRICRGPHSFCIDRVDHSGPSVREPLRGARE